ncbi:MAG: DUF4113 domain-containing protein [Nodosilinea sp. WJT8-NPBG4]|nr:DUF4113 domain-containing protein [Nodosilinea sp. WJT8-NPBG4]
MGILLHLSPPDAVKFEAMGLKPTWSMRSEYFSQRYMTYWGDSGCEGLATRQSCRQPCFKRSGSHLRG